VGIDTLHKEIELAENPLLEQPAARVRPLAAIERCCCYLSLLAAVGCSTTVCMRAGPAARLG
jgi:hypothetical protein